MITSKRIGILGVLLASFLVIIVYVQAWSDSGYDYRRPVYVNQTGASTLTNWTFLVGGLSGVDTSANMQADCDDIRFYDADDSTLLPSCHFANISSATSGCGSANAIIYCLNPSLGTSGEVDYMYYGNSSDSANWDETGTYDDSWKAVYHFEEEQGTTAYDSTINSIDGTLGGNAAFNSGGIVGYGVYFDGVTDYIDLGDNFDGFTSATWFACFNLSGAPETAARIWTDEDAFNMETGIGGSAKMHCAVNTGTWATADVAGITILTGKEYCGACNYNGSHLTAYLYNGTVVWSTQTAKTGTAGNSNHKTWLGCSDWSVQGTCDKFEFQGVIDEAMWFNGNLTTDQFEQLAKMYIDGDMSTMLAEEGGSDTTAPTITIDNPNDGTTYDTLPIDINVTLNENGDWCGFNLDGGANTTLANSSMTNWYSQTNSSLVSGTTYTLNVYCNDTSGNMGLNSSVSFTFNSGQPYLITYSHWNLTNQAESVYSVSYGDFLNDGYMEYLWSPYRAATDEVWLNVTKAGIDYGVWDNGTDVNSAYIANYRLVDFDNDGDNDVAMTRYDGDSTGGDFILMEIDSSRNVLNILKFDPNTDSTSNNPKPILTTDCDSDGTTDFITTWCGSGEINVMYECDYDTNCSSKNIYNMAATGEDLIKFESGATDYFYFTQGWDTELLTSISVRKITLDSSCDADINYVEFTNSSISMPGFVEWEYDTGVDIDGDGNIELGMTWQNDITNKAYIKYYEVSATGNLTFDFEVYPTGETTDHLLWNCWAGDHDKDGDNETLCSWKSTDLITKSFVLYECPLEVCTRTVIYSGIEHTDDDKDATPLMRTHGQFPSGTFVMAPMFDDNEIYVVNYTIPRWRNGGETRVWANDTDDLYLNTWCYDIGSNTALTYYVDYYKNDTLQAALSVSGTFTNGTEINLTVAAGNLSIGDIWHAGVTCGDGYQNSTAHNSTDIEIKGAVAGSPWSCASCADCSNYIQNSTAGETVQLVSDLTASSTCIDFNGADGITFDCNGYGIYGSGGVSDYGVLLADSDNNTIQGCFNISNFAYAILAYSDSDNLTLYNSTFNDSVYDNIRILNSDEFNITEITSSSATTAYFSGLGLGYADNGIVISSIFDSNYWGIHLIDGCDDNNITDSVFSGNTIGIEIVSDSDYSSGTWIYNNNFTSNSENIDFPYLSETHYFNITKTSATNIVGNANKGGNYYSDYSGNDFDGDDIGDTSYNVEGTFYDYLPLIDKDFSTVSVTTPDGDQNWSFSAETGDEELLNLNFSSTANVNNTIYFTLNDDLANTSLILVNSTTNLTLDDNEIVTINMTINDSAPSGSYSGNLTWTSANDSSQTGNVTIEFTVSAYTANVDILNSTWSAAYTVGNTLLRYFVINNTGNYNATHCNMTYSGSVGSVSFDQSDFEIENLTETQVVATFSAESSGSSSSAIIAVSCTATASGGTDSDTSVGSISVSDRPAGGGGGPTPTPASCDSYSAIPSGGFFGSNTEGISIPAFILSITNGVTQQMFSGELSESLEEYCTVSEYPLYPTPPNSQARFVIDCVAPHNTTTGTFMFTTDTGCTDSRTITIGSGSWIDQLGNWIFLGVTGTPIAEAGTYEWLIILVVSVIVILAFVLIIRGE